MRQPAFIRFFFRTVSIGKYQLSVAGIVWFALAFLSVLSMVLRGHPAVNNYAIYEGVFRHTLAQTNLYASYPAEYNDINHYGPVFGLLIAPFSLLPWWLGCMLWCMANGWFLYYAIMKLPLPPYKQMLILLLSVVELTTSIQNVQFNPMLAAWIILAFLLIDKEQEWAATFFIAAGFLVKIYGIIALVSFLFSKHKLRYIGWFALWTAVLVCAPMLISSPAFIVQSYADWYHAIVGKNEENIAGTLAGGPQDMSVAGMVRRIFRVPGFSQLWVLAPAGLLYLLPLSRIRAYQSSVFRLLYLALSLITVVIFSSSAESPTYIIAVCGAAIWFVLQPAPVPRWAVASLIFVFILTSMSPTDLFPRYIRTHFVTPYSLKALPCFVVWLLIVWQLLRQPFSASHQQVKEMTGID